MTTTLSDFKRDIHNWTLQEKVLQPNGDIYMTFTSDMMGTIHIIATQHLSSELVGDNIVELENNFKSKGLRHYSTDDYIYLLRLDYDRLDAFSLKPEYETAMNRQNFNENAISIITAYLAFMPFDKLFGFDFLEGTF